MTGPRPSGRATTGPERPGRAKTGPGASGAAVGPPPSAGGPAAAALQAVLFDLDDTLVPQADWLHGALDAVAAAAAELDPAADPGRFRRALAAEAAAGSARGGVIDRALAAAGLDLPVAPLVDAFLAYRAPALRTHPGVPELLSGLRRHVPLGLVTDGNAEVQRAKIAAAGLADAFDVVVCSDELGREHRKPDPLPFRTALQALGVAPDRAAFVGDRPDTDIAGASAVGMLAVRVLTGEHAASADVVRPALTVDAVAAAGPWLHERLAPLPTPGPAGTLAGGGRP